MPVFYLDTSALVKRYRAEQGTEVIEQLLSNPSPEDRFFLSFLSIIELTSAALRLVRGGQLREASANELLATFRGDVRDLFRVWPLNEDIATNAVAVIEAHRLRSADALHLATAERVASLASGTQMRTGGGPAVRGEAARRMGSRAGGGQSPRRRRADVEAEVVHHVPFFVLPDPPNPG